MPDLISAIRENVVRTSGLVNDLWNTPEDRKNALAIELRESGFAVRLDAVFREYYDDVIIDHQIDVIVEGGVAVQIRPHEGKLGDQTYRSQLVHHMDLAGLNYGLLICFGDNFKVMAVEIEHQHGERAMFRPKRKNVPRGQRVGVVLR